MLYYLKEIHDKNIWNEFVYNNKFTFTSFLVSWQWGDIQILAEKKVLRLGIFNEKGIQVGILPLIKNTAKRGTYLFAPHTPLVVSNIDFFEVLDTILPELKRISKKENAIFIRFNSPIENTITNKKSFKKLGFIDAPMHEHAEDTHILDLSPSEEDLLNNIKKEDRYYINRAIKEGVEIKIGNEQLETLIRMHNNHSKKVGYHAFGEEFINHLFEVFGSDATIISASYNNNVESILMTIKFGDVVVYYIAASDVVNTKFSPNYLCQWEAIKHARNSGAKYYNFWGVSPDNNPKHPIAGVSKFKRKFAGYDYSLIHAQDLPLSPLYWINYIIETLRRKKRGYYYKPPLSVGERG